jgi:signal transduction histidine kinase
LGNQIVAFKLWGPNGFVLYASDDNSSIGKTFPVEPRLAEAFQGQTTSRISDLADLENVSERKLASQLLETYSPVRAGDSGRIIAVAEFYQKADELQSDIAAAQRSSWLVVTAAMVLVYLLLSTFAKRASDTIDRQQSALSAQVTQLRELLAQNEELHERVRRGAARSAAINERFLRRISAELHDGPAQEISLALLRIDPGGRADDQDADGAANQPCAGELLPIRDALGHALQEIRAISSGLGLPELEQVALPEAIGRAVRAHERRTGTHVMVTLQNVPDRAPLAVKIAAYRLIQEALTNAYRHAAGAGQEVRATGGSSQLYLEVCDQGAGFDLGQTGEDEGHLGLLGMRERVQSLGGTFVIESSTGRGTKVLAYLPLGAREEKNGRVEQNGR